MNEKILNKIIFEFFSDDDHYLENPISGYYKKNYFQRNQDRQLLSDTKELGFGQGINKTLYRPNEVYGYSANRIINAVNMKFRWKLTSCKKISDQERKDKCLKYIDLLRFNDLKNFIDKCKDDSCRILIRNEIQKILDNF